MNWRETNEKNRARLQGQAGVHRVASELLLRGFNPTFPSVDCGADIVVEGGLRIQVKSAHLRQGNVASPYPQGAYWFKLTRGPVAHGNHGLRPRTPRIFSEECDFVVFWGIEQHRFWVVPSAYLDNKSLLVLGPDVAWAEIDIGEARNLREQGWTFQQIAEHFGVSDATIRRRLVSGLYLQPAEIRSMTQKVRECEGHWDAIRAAAELATGTVPQAVSTAMENEVNAS